MRMSDWSSDECSSDLPVGEPEQVIGAQPRLHVLAGGVVQRLAAREGMVHVGEHLVGGGADVDLLARDAERGDRKSVVLGQSVSVRVDFGGRRILKTQNRHRILQEQTYVRTIDT